MRLALAILVLALGAAPVRAADETRPAQPARTAQQVLTLRKTILDGLAAANPTDRAAAAELLVATWPDSTPILDEALASKSTDMRIEAVALLAREELGDQRERILAKLSDSNEAIRRQAVRVGRKLKWPELEAHLTQIITSDPSWPVRQEALRGLEDRGTTKCLRIVLAGYMSEKIEDRKNRFRRVLVAVIGSDHGEDVEAWATAVTEAVTKAQAAAESAAAHAPKK
jgi:hypothetical protein